MNRHVRLLLGLAAVLVLLTLGTPRPVHSDGIPVVVEGYEVEMPAQQAIIVWDEDRGHEDLILSIELLGSPEAAWVVPVPALPEVEPASADWFETLADLTRPELRERIVYMSEIVVAEQVGVGEVVDVDLLSREEVGIYDVSILSADEPGALPEWLHDNGYAFPEEGGPILDAYVEEGGWYFVAARVLPDESDQLAGDVHPLWFSFDTQQPIYPMRLTALLGESVEVLLYILADHRMQAEPVTFGTQFAGELELASPTSEDNAELRELLSNRRYYVTKLHKGALTPASMAEDFTFWRTISDTLYRKVIYYNRYVYQPATEPPTVDVLWLVWAVGLGMLGALAVVGLVRRQRSRRKPGDEQEA